MKNTISKTKGKLRRFSRSSLAVCLALLIMLGTMATFFAVVVDDATVGAKSDLASTGWGTSNTFIHYQLGGTGDWYDSYATETTYGTMYLTLDSDTTVTYVICADDTYYHEYSASGTVSSSSTSSDYYYCRQEGTWGSETTGGDLTTDTLSAGVYKIQITASYSYGSSSNVTLQYSFYRLDNAKVFGTVDTSSWSSDQHEMTYEGDGIFSYSGSNIPSGTVYYRFIFDGYYYKYGDSDGEVSQDSSNPTSAVSNGTSDSSSGAFTFNPAGMSYTIYVDVSDTTRKTWVTISEGNSGYIFTGTSNNPTTMTCLSSEVTYDSSTLTYTATIYPSDISSGSSSFATGTRYFCFSTTTSYTGIYPRYYGSSGYSSDYISSSIASDGSSSYLSDAGNGEYGVNASNNDRYSYASIKIDDGDFDSLTITITPASAFSSSNTYPQTSFVFSAGVNYDPFYIGGRFVTSSAHTGDYEGDFDIDSTAIKFTQDTQNDYLYYLDTGKTLAELSEELQAQSSSSYNPQYFIIHDRVTNYAVSAADYSGNSFQNYDSSDNYLTLNTVASPGIPNEMMFDDPDNTSDGTVKIWIDASDYDQGNSTSELMIWYEVEGETPAVADTLTFSASPTSTTVNKNITLTATIDDLNSTYIDNPTTELQFVFTDETNNTPVATVTGSFITNPSTGKYRATATTTSDAEGTVTYRVTVSTTSSYNGGTVLRSISKTTTATYNPATVYYTSDITSSTSSPTWTAIDPNEQLDTISTTPLSAGSSYTISLSDEDEYNPDFDDYTIGTCEYCKITKSNATVTIDDEDRTVRTYVITPLTSCSDPVITINSSTGVISAVATYDKYADDEKTVDQTKYVKYYFAKNVETDEGGTNYLDGNSGIHIRYYNNSITSKSGNAWAVPVKADGTTSNGAYTASSSQYTGGNTDAKDYQIIIDESQLYRYTSDASAKSTTSSYTNYYNVYVLEIPVWATSADLVGSNGSDMLTTDILSLNPNRIYVFWTTGDEDKQWSGVPLDSSFWRTNSSGHTRGTTTGYLNNQVPTKNFSTNLIKYDSDEVNAQLSTAYNSTNRNISTALYWGDFYSSQTQSYTNWDIALNLAQRYSEPASYYSSIWNIVDPVLSEDTTSMNPLGGGLLTGYGTDQVMPFFDYTYLANNESTQDGVYTDVDFPFYSSEYDGVTTYSYDSATDLNRLFSTSSSTYSLDTPHKQGANIGYLPFYGSGLDDPTLAFANEFDIDFYMTTTGTLQGTKQTHDINFNFSGDDDVWVFVDGVLVLDLGGDHMISAGSINFTDMKVYYKSTTKDFTSGMGVSGDGTEWSVDDDNMYTMDLQSIFEAHGVNFKNTDATTKHTLQMFYMERGRFESNMSLSFNLPQASGLNIRNTVTADNVNAGLQDAALKASNPDYFAYTVKNASATDTAIESLNDLTGYEYALLPSSTSDWSAVSTTPLFPYKYNVNRVFQGDTYVLGSTADSREQAAHDKLSSISESFALLLDNAFVLSDVYATTDNTLAKLSGVTDSSTGNFYLLGGQMANFTDKVRPNSYVQVLQKKNLGEAEADTSNNDIIQYKSINDNNSANYYLTSYSIYDEAAAKYIKVKTDYGVAASITDEETYYATDASASLDSGGSDNGFYFTNYAADTSNVNPAMTVDFYNDIAVGSLKVSKEITNSTSASDNFYFKVEFCQMFGDTDDSDWTEYSGLEYQIYNSDDDTLVSTATYSYGTSGIVIKPGQYALIEGIPVETRFNVTEVARAGYSLVDKDKTCTKPNGTEIDYTKKNLESGFYNYLDQSNTSLSLLDNSYTDDNDTDDTTDDYTYYCNMIPTVEETLVSDNNYISISTAAYQNKKDNFTIVFKYFDRYEEDGETAGINSSATTCSIAFESIPSQYINYVDDDVSKDVESIDFASMIGTEGSAFVNRISNVMCSYNCWTSQSDAVSDMATLKYYNNGTLTSYEEAAYPYHTNYLAQPNTSGEKWVTYYNSKGTEVSEPSSGSTGSDYLAVRQIVVWCRNYPKQYDVDVYGADSFDDLTEKTVGSDTLFVADSATSSKSTTVQFYFNQRFGYSYNEAQDAAGFIENYGIPGIYSDSSGNRLLPENYAAESFTNSDTTYYFAYWAYDAAGTQIASTDRSFMYRVCDDTKIYAVYSTDKNYGSVGISLSALDNDTYVGSNGTEYTRLNILASIVNADPGDKKIQKLAFVRVALSTQIRENSTTYTPAKISELMDTYKEQFKTLLTQYDATFSKSHTYTDVVLTLTTKGYVYTVADSITDTSSIVLSNKNRAQFTTSFKTSVLNNSNSPTCLAYTGAVKYNGEWIMSNNSLIYYNGTVKDNTATSW